jgi:hypothetical protein
LTKNKRQGEGYKKDDIREINLQRRMEGERLYKEGKPKATTKTTEIVGQTRRS